MAQGSHTPRFLQIPAIDCFSSPPASQLVPVLLSLGLGRVGWWGEPRRTQQGPPGDVGFGPWGSWRWEPAEGSRCLHRPRPLPVLCRTRGWVGEQGGDVVLPHGSHTWGGGLGVLPADPPPPPSRSLLQPEPLVLAPLGASRRAGSQPWALGGGSKPFKPPTAALEEPRPSRKQVTTGPQNGLGWKGPQGHPVPTPAMGTVPPVPPLLGGVG